MKRVLLSVFYLVIINVQLIAQVITVTPTLPTDVDQVTVIFDATKATRQDLLNYTGEVYAHTGVKVQGSTQWQYVIGAWPNNTTQPKLTRLGTNTYSLTISPSIRQFYNVPAGIKITQLCFVFRSSDGTKQTEDIFYNVYEQGITVNITSPLQSQPIYNIYSTIPVNVSANGSTSLALFIDGNQVTSTTSTSLSHTYFADQYGKHWVKAVASNATETKKDSVYIIIRPEVTVEALPLGSKPGVNIVDNQTVTFVLYDPPAKKTYCYLIGDFSNWMVDEQFYMKRTPDGKYYWLTVTGLNADKEYIYQYLLDGKIRLADPYCTKTSDQYDQYISATNYPNLVSYPRDKTSGVASVFKINSDSYTWTSSPFSPPLKKDLVIYELHVRDFVSGDFIGTAKDSISYLKKLGVNAIELMPINEFQGNDSWGYNPSFYFAPDKAYGTPNDYKAFIDECHREGIAVIMDIVLNHSYEESPLVQMYYNTSTYQPTTDNPWYNVTSPNTTYSWGYDFNHESLFTKAFVDSVLSYWLTEYKIDGFRFDFSKGFTNTPGDGNAYDASRIAILKHYADKIWSVNQNAYLILEHFCANTEETELSNYGMMIWGNSNYNYNEATMGWLPNSDFSWVSYKARGWGFPHLVGYMESHDEERLMFKNLTYGNSTNTAYNVRDLNTGLARNEMAALFFFTVPGPKMIWQFGELGYDISIDYNGRVGRKPIHWDYYENLNRRKLFNTYAQLIRLKKDYEVFKTTNFTLSFTGAKKWIKLDGVDMDALVMGNFNVQPETFTLDFPGTGKWYEFFSQDSVDLSNVNVNYTFKPGEYRLYTSKRIKKENVYVGINKDQNKDVEVEIWPNPNSGRFNIGINSNYSTHSSVSIYNSLGVLILEKKLESLESGLNIIEISIPSILPRGFYICKIQTGDKNYSKIVIVN